MKAQLSVLTVGPLAGLRGNTLLNATVITLINAPSPRLFDIGSLTNYHVFSFLSSLLALGFRSLLISALLAAS